MTEFTPLLIHTATLYTPTHVNIDGRVTTTEHCLGDFKCRFVQPTPTQIAMTNGAVENAISATVYADTEVGGMMQGQTFPLVIRTEAELWSGAYEVRKPPRGYESHSSLHHIEFDVVRVNHDGS